ncbi:MAG TPA: Ycf66 family protein [Nostoc sp.]|uniref:Ycf66 family protein n=1 Tax=Nostoc sp. TaxID=1180 RepID=UPI002D2C1ECE|nr:Ycf66 family protein [Nostoc sp.]HYX13261.1 Ycf66 family protein [Nostoc sp.]
MGFSPLHYSSGIYTNNIFCGIILFFQGWRLDPILQFEQFLLLLLIVYFTIKDIVINAVYRNR